MSASAKKHPMSDAGRRLLPQDSPDALPPHMAGVQEIDGVLREISAAIVAMQIVIGSQGAGATDEELEAVAEPLRQALILAQMAREQAFPDAAKAEA